MTLSRRSFLGTLAAAIAVGFAKVETALLERPGPTYIAGVDWGMTSDWVKCSYRGIPIVANEFVPRNVVYLVSSEFGPRYVASPETKAAFVARCRANARFAP